MISINVNNQRKLEVIQCSHDGIINVNTIDPKGNTENSEQITAGDFVTMLNWYRHQKSQGNISLYFE